MPKRKRKKSKKDVSESTKVKQLYKRTLKHKTNFREVEPDPNTYSDQNRRSLFNGGALDYVRMRADKHENVYKMPKQANHLRELADAVELKEMALRKLLWLNHGCNVTHGDGEDMVCPACMINFKRDSVGTIITVFSNIQKGV